MAGLKAGDGVRIVEREVSQEDTKNGVYFRHFGGLTGVVDKVYEDGSVCVDVDIDSLDSDMRKRHLQMQEAERKRWLESLSEEGRGRLSAEQRQLRIAYKILVLAGDVEPFKGAPKPRPEKKSVEVSGSQDSAARSGPARAPEPDVTEAAAASEEPKRVSSADLEAMSEAYLQSLNKDQ